MKLCVFCGSQPGRHPDYQQTAIVVGRYLAEHGIDIVYGGASVGLMGLVADSALEAGGKVYGVIPKSILEKEVAHNRLTDLFIVENMHERKAKMADLSDGFIALPGGAGTMEELWEQWTWLQLGIHNKPCGVLNTLGYFDPLALMVSHMMQEGFVSRREEGIFIIHNTIDALLSSIRLFEPLPPRSYEVVIP